MKLKCFLHYWPFVREIHQSLVEFPHITPVMRSFDVFLLSAWTSCWTNNRVASDWDAMILMWRYCNVHPWTKVAETLQTIPLARHQWHCRFVNLNVNCPASHELFKIILSRTRLFQIKVRDVWYMFKITKCQTYDISTMIIFAYQRGLSMLKSSHINNNSTPTPHPTPTPTPPHSLKNHPTPVLHTPYT